MAATKRRLKWWQIIICAILTLIGIAEVLIASLPFLFGEIAGGLIIPQLIEWIKTAL